MRSHSFYKGVLVVLMTVACTVSWSQETRVDGVAGSPKRGKELYRRYCIYCHGAKGDGTGENAPYLDPKPRDFTKATFKCRSTATGTLPLDNDLFETISRGIHASGMPAWRPLTKQQRIDLVAYIKTFSSRFTEERPGEPVSLPPVPPSSPESVQRGADLFQNMNCWSCHGKEGRGNGPASVGLTDSKGNPITPFDFTSGPHFKCGDSDQELFRDLVTGLDGTPMPSFADALKPDQIWDLVHFIKVLSKGVNVPAPRVAADHEN